MTQNIISLNFTDADLTTIDEGLALLEQMLAPLTSLSPDVRRGLVKMGDKSEAFCRETLMVLSQNTRLLPPSFDLAEAQNDLAHLDKIRLGSQGPILPAARDAALRAPAQWP